MSVELAPCPFCGGHPVTTEAMGEHWISCGTCTASATMKGKLKAACDAWNRRTPPAMSADHIGDAQGWRDIATAPRQEPVLVGHSGFLGWRRLAICNALGEWSYCDRPWLQQDPLDETPTHWMPLPPPPSAHPAPIKPSAGTGELRERVAQIIEAAIERHNPVNSLRHTMSDADEILDLIQSERGKAVPMTAQDLADHAADAFDNALPDDALPHEVGRAWKAVGERLAAILAERAEE